MKVAVTYEDGKVFQHFGAYGIFQNLRCEGRQGRRFGNNPHRRQRPRRAGGFSRGSQSRRSDLRRNRRRSVKRAFRSGYKSACGSLRRCGQPCRRVCRRHACFRYGGKLLAQPRTRGRRLVQRTRLRSRQLRQMIFKTNKNSLSCRQAVLLSQTVEIFLGKGCSSDGGSSETRSSIMR